MEFARTKYHELEKKPARHTSDSGFLQGPLCPIDQEYLILSNMNTDMVSLATQHFTFLKLPTLSSMVTEQEACVCCTSIMHIRHECDACRQQLTQALKVKSKTPQSIPPDAI